MHGSSLERARLAGTLAVVLALGCDANRTDSRSAPRVRYSYALTPSGSLYRVFAAGPITRGANTTVGLQLSYLTRAGDKAALDREADELIRAFGPELLLTPERALRLEARQWTPGKGFRPIGTLLFERKNNRWVRTATQPVARPQAPGGASAPDESSFPFVREKVDAAAAEATRWLGLLDRHLPETAASLSLEFAEKLAAAPEYLPNLLANRRSFGLPAPRTELYRMQSLDRDRPQAAPGDNVMIQYVATPPSAAQVLERVTMHRKGERWVVAGYLVQPVAAQPGPATGAR